MAEFVRIDPMRVDDVFHLLFGRRYEGEPCLVALGDRRVVRPTDAAISGVNGLAGEAYSLSETRASYKGGRAMKLVAVLAMIVGLTACAEAPAPSSSKLTTAVPEPLRQRR